MQTALFMRCFLTGSCHIRQYDLWFLFLATLLLKLWRNYKACTIRSFFLVLQILTACAFKTNPFQIESLHISSSTSGAVVCTTGQRLIITDLEVCLLKSWNSILVKLCITIKHMVGCWPLYTRMSSTFGTDSLDHDTDGGLQSWRLHDQVADEAPNVWSLFIFLF